MRKLLLLLSVLICSAITVSAQEEGIQFEKNNSWSKVVKKAKKQNKLIFIDCYTSWCGPCKTLSNKIFPQKAVGEYFNDQFVNVKYDCEKGEGITLKEKFKVPAYPTLLFYNPKTDQVEHQIVGAGTADWLIQHGKLANDATKNLRGMTEAYDAGKLSSVELGEYLKLLQAAYMKDKQSAVALSYLDKLDAEELSEKENWTLLMKNVNDPYSKSIQCVLNNRPLFYTKIGKEQVDQKLVSTIMNGVGRYAYWNPRFGEYDAEGCKKAEKLLQTIDLPCVPPALANIAVTKHYVAKDYKAMLDELKTYERYNFGGKLNNARLIASRLELLASTKDQEALKEAINWVSLLIARTNANFEKANFSETKAKLQDAAGDTVGAEKSRLDAKEFDKKGQEESGGKMMRAIKMG